MRIVFLATALIILIIAPSALCADHGQTAQTAPCNHHNDATVPQDHAAIQVHDHNHNDHGHSHGHSILLQFYDILFGHYDLDGIDTPTDVTPSSGPTHDHAHNGHDADHQCVEHITAHHER